MSFQPLSDQTASSSFGLPPVVKHLLIWTVLIYIASRTPGLGPILQRYAPLYAFGSPNFYPWQFVTYLFMHASIWHIGFNLFAFWMFGPAIENLWGSKRFLIYFFICGIGGGLTFVLVHSQPHLTAYGLQYSATIGNSGAIFGILLAFGMMFPDQQLMLLIPPIPMKAKYFVILFGAIELFSGVTGAEQGVAHFAHLGGMFFGFILIKYWQLRHRRAFSD